MSEDPIRTALLQTLVDVAPETDPSKLRADRPLRDQVELDSYDFLQWMIRIQDVLGVDVPEADYRRLSTLDDAVAYLRGHLPATAQRP